MMGMDANERLKGLKAWAHEHAHDLEAGISPVLNPFVARFMHALTDALVLGTVEAVEAAEIALVELDADWEEK